MSLGQLHKKITRNVRDRGVLPTIAISLRYLVSPVYFARRYRIYTVDLTKATKAPPSSDDFQFRLINADDHDLIAQIKHMEEWLCDVIDEKLRAGSICLVALDGSEVVGFNLVSFGHIVVPLIRLPRTLPPHKAWSDQVTVRRDYRGRGLATMLRLRVFEILRERGVRRLSGGTLPSNSQNLGLSRKVGLRVIADVQYTKTLGKQAWRVERVRG